MTTLASNASRWDKWYAISAAMSDAETDDLVGLRQDQQDTYRRSRTDDDQNHTWAMIFATKKFPGIKTDSIFNEGKFSSFAANGCEKKEVHMRKLAEQAGFSTNGKWYCSGLASYPGDPDGWVGGRDDVLAVCKRKNLTILDGYVTHKGHETPASPTYDIAPDLLDREVNEIMEAFPGSRKGDVTERVHELRTGKIDPNPARVKTPTEDW
jgi:hypothetical protein